MLGKTGDHKRSDCRNIQNDLKDHNKEISLYPVDSTRTISHMEAGKECQGPVRLASMF